MGGIVDFDRPVLDGLLDTLGLRKTWLSLLATNFQNRQDLAYIFCSPEFEGAGLLDRDLLDGLSIGEVSVLYEYSHAREDADARKSNGQFFTPDDVADFMASHARKFPQGRWLDPCSGIGNLSWHLIAQQDDPEEFLRTQVVLSDMDDLALLIARTLLTAAFQKNYPTLFDDIRPNFVTFDFLSVAESGRNELFNSSPGLDTIPEHDFVIVNPPYRGLRQQIDRFETARCADLYAYFLENIVKTSRGFISVTPQSFTNARKFESLRDLLLREFSDLTIFCFDNIPGNIFRGIKFGSTNTNTANSIRAAITVAAPGEGQPRITSLMRWRSSERERLFADVEQFLSTVQLTTDYFPKVSAVFQGLYERLRDAPALSSLCQKKPTNLPLYVPSSPRYFIPGLKTTVERSSQRVVYFRSEHDRDLAYTLINSSLMYWWWRIRDGGMTVSEETLLSLPVPDFEVDKDLVRALEESEVSNKVYKMNAGARQENVKHPLDLILRLNDLVAPDYAQQLLLTHENSEFAQSGHLPVRGDCGPVFGGTESRV